MDVGIDRKTSVLMVCLGNICRSPLAEAALRAAAERKGADMEVDSAGTGDWHIGHPPDPRARHVAQQLGGIDIGWLRARQVTHEDFESFDHIVAMDSSNLKDLLAMRPPEATAQLSMLLDHLPGNEGLSVADPYYGDAADFEICWHQVSAAVEGFLRTLR